MSREMKDSGVEWLGYIPQHWDVDRIKRAISSIKGGIWGDEAVGDENDIDCVRIADFERNYYRVGDVDFTKRNIPIKKQRDYLLKYGDLLIEKSGGGDKTPVGFVALFDKQESAVYSNFTAKLTVNQNEADSNFMRYLFAALYEQGISFRSIKQTTGIQNIDMKAYLDEKVGYPQIDTQRKIANRLDLKVMKINLIIEKTKSTIEDYKLLKQSIITEAVTKGLDKNVEMKESGVEWIRQIPNNWSVTYAKYVMRKLERPRKINGNTVICSNSGESKLLGEKNTGLISLTQHDYQGVEVGDLLIHGMDTWHGAIAVSEYEGDCTSVVHVCDSENDKKYLEYYFKSLANLNVYKVISNGVRQNTSDFRSWKKFSEIKVLLPPKEEQEKIARVVDLKNKAIDNILQQKETLLTELQIYKKSLIYEYVTGKKEVE